MIIAVAAPGELRQLSAIRGVKSLGLRIRLGRPNGCGSVIYRDNL